MKRIACMLLVSAMIFTAASCYAAAFNVNYGNLYNARIENGRLIPPTSPYPVTGYTYLKESFYGLGKGRLIGITSYVGRDLDAWSFTYQGNTDKLATAVNTYYGRAKQYTSTFTFTEKGEIKSYDYSFHSLPLGWERTQHDEYSYEYDAKGRMKKATCVSTIKDTGRYSGDYDQKTVKTWDIFGNLNVDTATKQYVSTSGSRVLSSETASHDFYFGSSRIYNDTIYKEYDVSTGKMTKYTRTQTLYSGDGKIVAVIVRDLMPKSQKTILPVQEKPQQNYTFTSQMANPSKTEGLIQK